MKKYILAGVAALCLQAAAVQATAETLTFDNLPGEYNPVPNGYGGLDWNNFYYLNGTNQGPSGYQNGVVSSPNVAYDAYGNPASFSRAGGFELVSGYFTAAWNDGLSVLVQGYNGATLVDTTTFVINTSGPTLETFDWTGLTNVVFTPSGGVNHGYDGSGAHFALDNLVIGGAGVPEPATWALMMFGVGLVGAAARVRRRLAIA